MIKILSVALLLGVVSACAAKVAKSSAEISVAENQAAAEQVHSMIQDLERLEQEDFLPELAAELPY